MINYISIKPIRVGELQEKTANAIVWQINGLFRNSTMATADCSLIYVLPDGGTVYVSSFIVQIDNDTLQSWGADDSVIDDVILAYSPLFEKENS